MIIVGITGVIGSGKSTLSALLRTKGLTVIDIDELGRMASATEEVLAVVKSRFGPQYVKDGTIDREKMKELAFGDKEALRALEEAIHPVVHRELWAEMEALRASGATAVVIDHPLLFETGLAGSCDKVVVVSAGAAAIRERVRDRGMTPEDMERRLSFQIPLAEKERRADYVVCNEGTKEDLEAEAEKLIGKIRKWEEE